jgi:hypothetical protein
MFGIFKTYRHLLSRGAAKAFNQIAAYVTNLCADESIDFHRPDSPTAENPPCIGVNEEWLNGKIGVVEPPSTQDITSGVSQTNSSALSDTFTAGAAGGTGRKMWVLCRGYLNGADATLFWREVTITSDGRIYKVSAEDNSQALDVAAV